MRIMSFVPRGRCETVTSRLFRNSRFSTFSGKSKTTKILTIITRATCGRPSLGLPFGQSIYLSSYLSFYLSIYHVAFGKSTQKSLRIALMSSSEPLVVFSFAEKAFNQNSKRLTNQAL